MWDLIVSVPDHCLSFLLFNQLHVSFNHFESINLRLKYSLRGIVNKFPECAY